jgi:hypothetical protein
MTLFGLFVGFNDTGILGTQHRFYTYGKILCVDLTHPSQDRNRVAHPVKNGSLLTQDLFHPTNKRRARVMQKPDT